MSDFRKFAIGAICGLMLAATTANPYAIKCDPFTALIAIMMFGGLLVVAVAGINGFLRGD